MSRKRPFQVNQVFVTAAIGATDGQTLIDLVAPFAGARLDSMTGTVKTAGVGTGTFTVVLEEQGGTDLSAISAAVDADAAANTVSLALTLGNGTAASADGVRLAVATVKTGTVTTGAVLILSLNWIA